MSALAGTLKSSRKLGSEGGRTLIEMSTVSRGLRFEQTIPYDTPESLDDLQGPTSGLVRVSPRIDTSLNPVYNVSSPSNRWSLYSAVVRDGLPADQVAILDRGLLLAMWVDLNLPVRCRRIWEDKFPELAEISKPKAV